MDYADSILDLVGDTPLVRLSRVTRDLGPAERQPLLLAKLEALNPGGSVKDRIGLPMIEAAERAGLLRPGGTIIEPTSGNTGHGLAIAAALKGYRCIFVMADKQSEEKRAALRAWGAKVIVTPTDVAPEDPRSYYSVAKKTAEETPNAFYANQYHNPSNPAAHYDGTGPEIWDQFDGRVDVFVAGLGTGGTLMGVGRRLKRHNPELKVYAAEPLPGEKVQGLRSLDEGFIPEIFDPSVLDGKFLVGNAESIEALRDLTALEGIFAGVSAGG
ncbi:MAG: PLP-dependent cysteine synthase family protein, partial [Chloroflexota bacterium]